jgi:DNA-binding LytR/AlgR family response regulator
MHNSKVEKYSCLIVDDNAIARMLLKQLITQLPNLDIVAECSGAIEANNFFSKQTVDILFLDIEMPEMTGFELLKSIGKSPVTILTSGSKGYVEEAYEMNVADYLIKPVSLSRLAMAVQRAVELVNKKDVLFTSVDEGSVFIKENKILRKLLIKEIYWLEAKGDYVKICLADKYHIIHSTLKQLEEKLPSSKFIRVHRSYVIATDKIEYIEDNVLYLNNTPIPISESNKGELLQKLKFL